MAFRRRRRIRFGRSRRRVLSRRRGFYGRRRRRIARPIRIGFRRA